MSNFRFNLIALVSGANVMVLELMASRLLAPYIGTTIYTWTSIIGVILAALSLGYYFGGKYADEKKDLSALSSVLLVSAVFTAGISFLLDIGAFFASVVGPKLGSLLLSLLLFFVPSFLFGMVSPFLIRLTTKSVATSGESAGQIYAISTVGSIAGTFLAGFILIPLLGVRSIILIVSFSTLLLAFLASSKGRFFDHLIAGILCILIFFVPTIFASGGYVYMKDSGYYQIKLVDKEGIRYLFLDRQYAAAMIIDSSDLYFNYTKYISISTYLSKPNASYLFLGAGGCTEQSYLLRNFPKLSVDAVEIDPEVFKVCTAYFNYTPSARSNEIVQDARTYIASSEKTYDVIRVDTFNSHCQIPFHMATIEAVSLMKKRLNPNGLIMVNIISAFEGPKSRFFLSQLAAYQKLFNNTYVFLTRPENKFQVQNIVLVAGDNGSAVQSAISDAGSLFAKTYVATKTDSSFLTDDYAPVESFLDDMC